MIGRKERMYNRMVNGHAEGDFDKALHIRVPITASLVLENDRYPQPATLFVSEDYSGSKEGLCPVAFRRKRPPKRAVPPLHHFRMLVSC